ncbi:hypothetical protein GCM10017620_31170 [Brevundimonas intermedia]|uniref:Uncharacterized protein n=1 Tax=Brevundimonas intermedia TaxID=74315 RepID=A0ABQ5TGP2_9CAUL|nr:hypothetical protein [Brevundimonas intermedia]GLK50143.1 hypothetical protein GCM10017620_31170 [Brevundimonas intermedia]
MTKPTALIAIDTSTDLATPLAGRIFIDELCREPKLTPELVSWDEKFKDPFISPEHFLEKWWAQIAVMRAEGEPPFEFYWGPHWKRKSKLASRGYVKYAKTNKFGDRIPGTFWFQSRWERSVNFDQVFDRWASLARANVGMLHLFGEAENPVAPTAAESRFQSGSFGGPLNPGIPNIGWAMAYGEGYAHEVDVDRIRAHGFPVEVRDGVVVIRVTEQLSDVADDFPRFSRRRAELKSLFRPDLFWIKDEPKPVLTVMHELRPT